MSGQGPRSCHKRHSMSVSPGGGTLRNHSGPAKDEEGTV